MFQWREVRFEWNTRNLIQYLSEICLMFAAVYLFIYFSSEKDEDSVEPGERSTSTWYRKRHCRGKTGEWPTLVYSRERCYLLWNLVGTNQYVIHVLYDSTMGPMSPMHVILHQPAWIGIFPCVILPWWCDNCSLSILSDVTALLNIFHWKR